MVRISYHRLLYYSSPSLFACCGLHPMVLQLEYLHLCPSNSCHKIRPTPEDKRGVIGAPIDRFTARRYMNRLTAPVLCSSMHVGSHQHVTVCEFLPCCGPVLSSHLVLLPRTALLSIYKLLFPKRQGFLTTNCWPIKHNTNPNSTLAESLTSTQWYMKCTIVWLSSPML